MDKRELTQVAPGNCTCVHTFFDRLSGFGRSRNCRGGGRLQSALLLSTTTMNSYTRRREPLPWADTDKLDWLRSIRLPRSLRFLPSSGPRRSIAPLSPIVSASTSRFVVLCMLWYASSAMSSNTGKSIMMQFRYPVTLTFVQFGFVATYSLLCMSPIIPFSTLRPPTRALLRSTIPMGMFQVGGHMFSSMAISRIPVSTVHTIKVCGHSKYCLSPCSLLSRRCPHYSQWQHMRSCFESHIRQKHIYL